MRIALATLGFLPSRGGGEYVVHHLANEWASQGHEVRVFNAITDEVVHPEAAYSVARYRVMRGCRRFGYHRFPWRQVSSLTLGRGLRRFAPDYISAHFAYPVALYLADLAPAARWTVTAHGGDVVRDAPGSDRDRYVIDETLGRALRAATAVISIAPIARRSVEELGVPSAQCFDIPNGVRLADFRAPARFNLRSHFGLPADARVILTVGRNFPQKNLAMGIRAFREVLRQVPGAFYVLVGKGTSRLAPLVEELGLAGRVILHEELLGDSLVGAHQQASVYLSTSVWEFCPLVILEAIAAGTPQVATDVPGNRELIVPGPTGLLVPLQSVEAMSNALVTLLSSEDLRAQWRENCLRRAQSIGWDQVARRYLEAAGLPAAGPPG